MARSPVSSLAHSYLNTFAELLHSCKPEKAVAKLSRLIDWKKLDVVSTNALYAITQKANNENPKDELLSRTRHTKQLIDTCTMQLSEIAPKKLRGKNVVAHPLSAFGARMLRDANSVRFISADQLSLRILPETDFEQHQPLTAHKAMENADLALLEPNAITKEGAFVERGGRLLSELARSRGIPVYVLATSWHVTPSRPAKEDEEIIPPELLAGVISEHGIYPHKEFIARVQKSFPQII